MSSVINNPDYYGGKGNRYEAIKVISAWRCNFSMGNAYKYIDRAGLKVLPGRSQRDVMFEDYMKARWYINNQLNGLRHGAEYALSHQPTPVDGPYAFEAVCNGRGHAATFYPIFKACFNQRSIYRVDAALKHLDVLIKEGNVVR